jgi:hypothetical protein
MLMAVTHSLSPARSSHTAWIRTNCSLKQRSADSPLCLAHCGKSSCVTSEQPAPPWRGAR